MVAVSKEESMLLIQHAISAYLNEGKNQKELGELLGIDGSRISEAKIGKWKLSPSQRQVIIDNYGYPRRGKGQYINAEIYNSVTEFLGDYEESSNQRLKHKLYSFFRSENFQRELSFCVKRAASSSKESSLLYRIDELLSLSETKSWYEYIKENNINLYPSDSVFHRASPDRKVEDIDVYVIQVGLSTIDTSTGFIAANPYPEFMAILYRMAGFKYELMPEFCFDKNFDIEPVTLNELVITGDVVLELRPNSDLYDVCDEDDDDSNILRGQASLPFNKLSANLFGRHDFLYELKNKPDMNSKSHYKPDNWSRIVLRLYLSESMNYHLWIRLDNGNEINTLRAISRNGEVRNIVIKDLCRLDFLNEMELIRKWCGYDCDMSADLKHELAKLGGYIPGAKVL
ncbi:hypothetical protein HWV00_21325 (plasmid) [Moritella sp. 24]|uniref:hypothetical protein n=1 Tax=Moritella sp. 24 TaxID=2746230 RepID=UPI001BAD9147|nr:hypothetical protein [Moritella sp. 24]QUM78817.1 hypothetical protein HWV00_21325 [Moritella sp. 24]